MIMITMNNKQQDERHGGQQHQQHDGDHHHHQHGAQAMSAAYQTHRLQWEGITIEVRYDPDWSPSYRDVYGYPLAHLEIGRTGKVCPADDGDRLPLSLRIVGGYRR
jgi:hypothetical protein